jgi:hypothetical protein
VDVIIIQCHAFLNDHEPVDVDNYHTVVILLLQSCTFFYYMHTVTETEVVTILLSNDYCSCIELPCDERGRGLLTVAISNPYSGQKDFICNVALSDSDPLTGPGGVACYNSNRCLEITNFLQCDDEYPYFFQICEYPNDNTRCSVCFQNVNELNGTRMDFFWYQINICTGQGYYHDRMYFRSFALKSKNISYNHYSCSIKLLF